MVIPPAHCAVFVEFVSNGKILHWTGMDMRELHFAMVYQVIENAMQELNSTYVLPQFIIINARVHRWNGNIYRQIMTKITAIRTTIIN